MSVEIVYGSQVTIPGNSQITLGASLVPVFATGGSEADISVGDAIYRVHTFTSTGILTVTSGSLSAEYLVVAGGGGGAPASFQGGGGGAGGLLTGSITLNSGNYTINVGAGGAADTVGDNSFIGGSPTGPFIILSNGGGEGGNYPRDAGGAGGSGGGGGGAQPFSSGGVGGPGIPGQGFPGGSGSPLPSGSGRGAGGGGAGASGTPGPGGSAGGIGTYVSIGGGPVYYAFGGPGGGGSAGPSNSGAGGGSAGNSGGSGIVVVRYRIA